MTPCLGYTTVVQILLERGANMSSKNSEDRTALHEAIRNGINLSFHFLTISSLY